MAYSDMLLATEYEGNHGSECDSTCLSVSEVTQDCSQEGTRRVKGNLLLHGLSQLGPNLLVLNLRGIPSASQGLHQKYRRDHLLAE